MIQTQANLSMPGIWRARNALLSKASGAQVGDGMAAPPGNCRLMWPAMSPVSRFFGAHPLWTACLLVAVGSGIGYAVASKSSGGLQDALFVASTTLVFGALLGGVVKFLLEDLQRLRERPAENARFVKQMLDDLKSVWRWRHE